MNDGRVSEWVEAGTIAEVRRRRKTVLAVPGAIDDGVTPAESVLVLWTDDGPRAFSNVCIHRQKLLERGVTLNGRLVCPGHQWAFDLDTGWESKMQRCQPMYDVRVEDDIVQVDLASRAARVDEESRSQ